jgi:hypothetical protein
VLVADEPPDSAMLYALPGLSGTLSGCSLRASRFVWVDEFVCQLAIDLFNAWYCSEPQLGFSPHGGRARGCIANHPVWARPAT